MGACLKKVLKITKGTLLNFSFRKINQLIIKENLSALSCQYLMNRSEREI